jgi:hypothetical protein
VTGGDFGLEGSVVTVALWAAVALVSYAYIRRAQAARSTRPVPAPAYEQVARDAQPD